METIFPSPQLVSGTGELLDELVKHFEDETEKQDDDLPKFAVIGRPNVGKSSY